MTPRILNVRSVKSALVAVALVAGCSAEPLPSDLASTSVPAAFSSDEPYAPEIEPAAFVAVVDNEYFPLTPGTTWIYQGSGESSGEVDTVEVLEETRTVMGVTCTVVRDVVARDGEPVEVTEDWYAQDRGGNVWYFGEETAEYKDGAVVGTTGAWEAGVDGALPGIIMPAVPAIGVTYRQEYYQGEAEDLAKVLEEGESAEVPLGSYEEVLVTQDWSPLEPDVVEHKFYAPAVGLVMERQVTGGESAFELVEFDSP